MTMQYTLVNTKNYFETTGGTMYSNHYLKPPLTEGTWMKLRYYTGSGIASVYYPVKRNYK